MFYFLIIKYLNNFGNIFTILINSFKIYLIFKFLSGNLVQNLRYKTAFLTLPLFLNNILN